MRLALYKAKGKIGNAGIRWWTGSKYSHCELVIDGYCYSSSVADRGVRKKYIDLDPKNWDFIEIPWANKQRALEYFQATDDFTYGWLSLITSQLFNRNAPNRSSQFCSEWAANALGVPDAVTYSPKTLAHLCEFVNWGFEGPPGYP